MKKGIVFVLSASLLLSSCYSAAGEGALVGGNFGHVIGSAIGGLAGGWRGHDVGAIVGTVSGVVAGAAIGAAIDNAHEKKYEEQTRNRQNGINERESNDSRYDRRAGGDSFYADEAPLEIRNAVIREAQHDGVLTRGEQCTVSFEIYNISDESVYNVRPLVSDVTGNKHVKVSPNLLIESIAPRQGVRYSATIVADKKLKDGEITVSVGVAQGRKEVSSQTRCFRVPTAKSPH